MSVNGMNWNPSEVAFMKVHDQNFKRIVTKQNRVYWFRLTELYLWEKINNPQWFGRLEEIRRSIQNGI